MKKRNFQGEHYFIIIIMIIYFKRSGKDEFSGDYSETDRLLEQK